MREYKWLNLDDVLRSVPAMNQQGVSKVARGIEKSNQTREGWVQAYIETGGNPVSMANRLTGRSDTETWQDRRQQFLARHLGKVRKDNEPLWKDGEPTRRHLGLIAWGYTPDVKKLRKWLETQPSLSSGEWKRGVRILRKNRSVGYNSWAWTTQDWRSLFLHKDGSISYEKKCGGKGTKLPSGRPRLCLPVYVIESLMKTKSGRKILRDQIKKKQRAQKGERVAWHSKIKELHRELESMTPLDDPKLRKNPNPVQEIMMFFVERGIEDISFEGEYDGQYFKEFFSLEITDDDSDVLMALRNQILDIGILYTEDQSNGYLVNQSEEKEEQVQKWELLLNLLKSSIQ